MSGAEANAEKKKESGRFIVMFILLALLVIGMAVWGITSFVQGGREIEAKALSARVEADLKMLQASLIRYKTNSGQYPTTGQGLDALVEEPTEEPIPESWKSLAMRKMLEDPWGNPYRYQIPSERNPDAEPFEIWSVGPDGIDGTEDDICLP